MKQSGNKQFHRKAQAFFALLLYKIAQGPVDVKYFADKLQQICIDRIKSAPIDPDVLLTSSSNFDLGKLPKKKRFERKIEDLQHTFQRYIKETGQPSDNDTLTIRDIVSDWVDLTGQDKEEFISKVSPKLTTLVRERCKIQKSGIKKITLATSQKLILSSWQTYILFC